jgi:hypothetical protein
MINDYLARLEGLLIANPSVLRVEIVRQSISPTESESILNHRYRIKNTVVPHTPIAAFDALEIILGKSQESSAPTPYGAPGQANQPTEDV